MESRTGAARRPRATIAFALLAACLVVGCRTKRTDGDTESSAFLEEGTDTSAAESDAQLLTSSLVSSSSAGTIGLASQGTDLEARDIGDGARAIYLPRGCLTVTHDDATRTVTYRFNQCLGPNGLRSVTGQVKARYTLASTRLHLDLTADGLSVNEATIDWAATADVTSSDNERTMKWKAQLDGVTAGGRLFSRTSDHTVSWRLGEACFELSGFSEGNVRKREDAPGDSREIRTDIAEFRRCRRGCPESGTITVTNVTRNKKVELRYDGTNRATFTGTNGKTQSVRLLCRP